MGEKTKFYTKMNSVSLLVVLSALAASAAGDEVPRKPKQLNQEVQSSQEDQLDRRAGSSTTGSPRLLSPPLPPSQPPSVYLVNRCADKKPCQSSSNHSPHFRSIF